MNFDINFIKTKVLIKYPYFGMITMNVNYEMVDNPLIPTACTDGKTIYFNPNFMNKLTVDEQIFVVAHEICHIAFNHIERAEDKNPDIWNYATDAVINAFLKKDGLPIPLGMIDEKDGLLYAAEELYERLLKDTESEEKIKGNDSHHEIWKDKKLQEELEKIFKDAETLKKQKRIKHAQDKIAKEKESDIFKKNKEQQKELLQKMREEMINEGTNHEQDKQANGNIRNIGSVGEVTHIIDWRYLLRESITYNLDFSYRNATIEDGVLTSHLEEIPHSEVEIVLDTSGSVNEELLKSFLRECKNILQSAKVKVGCFDTKFYGFHEIKNFHDIDNMKYEGGGGTDFDVAVNAFSRRVINRIIFTDGWADPPKNKLSVIWVIFGSKKIDPQGSKVIYVDEKSLVKKHHTR